MGPTSRLRGSGPGGCTELEPDVGYCWYTDHLSLSKFFARSSLSSVRAEAERRHPGNCWHEAPAPFIYLGSTRANARWESWLSGAAGGIVRKLHPNLILDTRSTLFRHTKHKNVGLSRENALTLAELQRVVATTTIEYECTLH